MKWISSKVYHGRLRFATKTDIQNEMGKKEVGKFEPKLENFDYWILYFKVSNFDRYCPAETETFLLKTLQHKTFQPLVFFQLPFLTSFIPAGELSSESYAMEILQFKGFVQNCANVICHFNPDVSEFSKVWAKIDQPEWRKIHKQEFFQKRF